MAVDREGMPQTADLAEPADVISEVVKTLMVIRGHSLAGAASAAEACAGSALKCQRCWIYDDSGLPPMPGSIEANSLSL